MDHGKLRGSLRHAETLAVDLGHEPPLSVDGESTTLIDRRRISVQWFSATILTGLCGAALMGGAVFASLDGESRFAAMPERLETALRGTLGAERAAIARKSDRLPLASELPEKRQVIRISTIARVGNREVVRVRPFVRVSSNLSLSLSELSADIPPLNLQKLLTDAEPQGDAVSDAAPDAEVSFVTRDLAPLLTRAKLTGDLPLDQVLGRVSETANWTGNAPRPTGPVLAGVNSGAARLAYASEGSNDPYAGFEPRIVPENVTLLPKSRRESEGASSRERTVVVKKGDTVASILRDMGATDEETAGLTAALGARGKDGGVKEGAKIRILVSPASAIGQRLQPVRVTVMGDTGAEAIAALSDLGKYVAVDVTTVNDPEVAVADEPEEEDDGTGVRLYQSIYETALRQQVPRPVIEDLIRIYSYDVDFQRRSQPGDSFEVLFAGDDDNASGEKNEVLFAALRAGGELKRYYRYQSPDDGIVDYYDETGKSAKKFLVRKPTNIGIMRSGFGARNHPILGYSKMHTGVDWAAPLGTPIFAAGNGTVEKVGWEGGYGKYVRIRHTNGYETAYGHMTAFARGMEPGTRVHQGQVIGFVGSTGLSTGAHVHYEILVNGRFVDPMRIRLPRGRVLTGPMLSSFEEERARLDAMMARPGTTRTAQVSPAR